jgi:hypothetical protein
MGGAGADVEPRKAVAGMLDVVDALASQDSGCFRDWQGTDLPW